jgi:purine nucleoside permease
VTVTGFSPLFPNAHCTSDHDICQLTTGEAEINAASTITALYLSPLFQLSKTYFLIAGIAGVNPHQGTTGTVAAFARFAIQAALEYELDSREIPANWTSGYWPQGTGGPNNYPLSIYGTEAFELNIALRDKAIALATNVTLNDSASAASYRAMYGYAPATEAPKVIAGDSVCADVYYSGAHICEYFGNYTQLITNGSGVYAMAAQVDSRDLTGMRANEVGG